MSHPIVDTRPPRSFWITSWLALVWNVIGDAAYLMAVTMSPATLAAMPPAEQALYTGIPWWATSAYAIAVWGGTLASIGLLLRRAWAAPLFAASLAGIVVQMTHALFFTTLLQVKAASAAAMPLLVTVIAIYLLLFARGARRRGWLA